MSSILCAEYPDYMCYNEHFVLSQYTRVPSQQPNTTINTHNDLKPKH